MQVDILCVLCNGSLKSSHHVFSICSFFTVLHAESPIHFSADRNLSRTSAFFFDNTNKIRKRTCGLFIAVAIPTLGMR